MKRTVSIKAKMLVFNKELINIFTFLLILTILIIISHLTDDNKKKSSTQNIKNIPKYYIKSHQSTDNEVIKKEVGKPMPTKPVDIIKSKNTKPSLKSNDKSSISIYSSVEKQKDISIPYINTPITTKLSGVTFEGRQQLISRMSVSDKISIRRVHNNKHDKNAIGIFNNKNQNVGWIPAVICAYLAPKMDDGAQLNVKINRILGGNGNYYGLEITISNEVIEQAQNSIQNSSTTLFNNNYNRYDDEYSYSPDSYFWDEDSRGDDDYDPSEDWSDLYDYNENH